MNIPLHMVIVRPVETEKVVSINGLYAFIVHKDAKKPQIRKAVETFFSVTVRKVNTLNRRPLERSFGRKKGVQKGYKLAYVSLADGVIDFTNL